MSSFFKNLRYDLPAGIVVFLVAVPLCLGIAVASGAPPFSGILAGIVGGIVVTIFSGSQLGVSGPAAGLAAIVLVAIEDLGGFEIFLLAVVIAGVIQLILGFLQAGIIGYYFPNSVIKGMLSGIGIFIFLKQFKYAFGWNHVTEEEVTAALGEDPSWFAEMSYNLGHVTTGAIVVTVVSLAILVLWESKFMKNMKWTSIVPGPLVAVTSGLILHLVAFGDKMALRHDHLVEIPEITGIKGFVSQLSLPDFSAWNDPHVWKIGLIMAIVASLETLLCLEATDKLDPQKRISPTNKELKAQGIGNLVAGLIGGLPVTQVIVRSSANIQSGGKSRASSLIHGILILVSVITLTGLMNSIPLASLAAILFMVGYKLAKPSIFKSIYAKGWTEFIPFMVTILGIIFIDLLWGISLGMAVAIMFILYNNMMLPYEIKENDDTDEDYDRFHYKIEFSEHVSFLNKARVIRTIDKILPDRGVIFDFTKTKSVHGDIIEILKDFKDNAHEKKIEIKIIGLDDETKEGDWYTHEMESKHVEEIEGKIGAVKSEMSKMN